MNKREILDEYFIDSRSKLLEVASFLDRLSRAEGASDYRMASLASALNLLNDDQPEKTRRILECFSDPTNEPVDAAPGKGASGAWPGFNGKAG